MTMLTKINIIFYRTHGLLMFKGYCSVKSYTACESISINVECVCHSALRPPTMEGIH